MASLDDEGMILELTSLHLDNTLEVETELIPEGNGLDLILEEEEIESKAKRFFRILRARLSRKRFLILLCALCIFTLLIVIALTSILVPVLVTQLPHDQKASSAFSSNDSPSSASSNSPSSFSPQSSDFVEGPTMEIPPLPDLNEENIRDSSEYQITLDNIELWQDKEYMVQQFLLVTNDTNPYLSITYEDAKFSSRNQKKLNTDGLLRCWDNRNIRIREYTAGWNVGHSYVDIKSNSSNKTKACDVPFWPAEQYRVESAQKCERDVHQCDDKYSRETRIFFDGPQTWETCYDVLRLYPWAFDNLPEDQQYNPVDQIEFTYWWTALYEGRMNESTDYQIAFTLRYHTEEESLTEGSTPNYGEWSIRIYENNEGWDEEVVESASELWITLSEEFGNKDTFGHCS